MPFWDGPTLVSLGIVALGAGLFLRLVAREKRRREKHLEHRLQEKLKALEAEEQETPKQAPEDEEAEVVSAVEA